MGFSTSFWGLKTWLNQLFDIYSKKTPLPFRVCAKLFFPVQPPFFPLSRVRIWHFFVKKKVFSPQTGVRFFKSFANLSPPPNFLHGAINTPPVNLSLLELKRNVAFFFGLGWSFVFQCLTFSPFPVPPFRWPLLILFWEFGPSELLWNPPLPSQTKRRGPKRPQKPPQNTQTKVAVSRVPRNNFLFPSHLFFPPAGF